MSQGMYSVATLVHYIKESLDNDFNLRSILIKGEVSNFTNHRSGHWYFTLKDAKAKISCVMFASYASRSSILLKEGMKVIVNASVSMYEAGGSVQLYVTAVQADGLGDLFLKLEQVKEKLSKEGLFDPSHKKELPMYPMRIGVLSAKTGAAIQDILTTIARRWPLADVCVYPTLVQGVQATSAIIKQLEHADAQQHDVILLARGGGAIEDLWCFNEESLARCIFAMKSVIVTGVGHETDTTLVDYVSDARGATPTAAAELITPDINEVKQAVQIHAKRLQQRMQTLLMERKQQLLRVKQYRYLKDPLSYIVQQQMTLAMHVKELGIVDTQVKQMAASLHKASHKLAMQSVKIRAFNQGQLDERHTNLKFRMEQFTKQAQRQMKEQITLLDAYSPLQILKRGYHISYQEGHIIKSIEDVNEQEELKIRLQDGYVIADVLKKEAL